MDALMKTIHNMGKWLEEVHRPRFDLLFGEIRSGKRKPHDGRRVRWSVRSISMHGHFTGQYRVAKIHGRYGV